LFLFRNGKCALQKPDLGNEQKDERQRVTMDQRKGRKTKGQKKKVNDQRKKFEHIQRNKIQVNSVEGEKEKRDRIVSLV
jgi:hypothetical protein